MAQRTTLLDEYRFAGFRPLAVVRRGPSAPDVLTVRLVRRGSTVMCGRCGLAHRSYYDRKFRYVRDKSCGDARVYLVVEVRRVYCKRCAGVKQEKLDWLATNPAYTKRFAMYVGRRCRSTPLLDVAAELKLSWHTVKNLEIEYMKDLLARHPIKTPQALGIDEVSIGHGQKYRIVVSDLVRGRPIWFGGADRSEASLDMFYAWLSPEKAKEIKLAVMDMWKAFTTSTRRNIPHAPILYDKFHVLRHLGDALDTVRKSEYRRLADKDRSYIKGQKYTLLSHRKNLTTKGRVALKLLLAANKRLNTAYLLKETFGQLWTYSSEGWARRFFENWKAALKWQRLKPYEKFAAMIERHWNGIAAYCLLNTKISLGFVEGLNNKIGATQRRAYGIRDEEYLRLKILTFTLDDP